MENWASFSGTYFVVSLAAGAFSSVAIFGLTYLRVIRWYQGNVGRRGRIILLFLPFIIVFPLLVIEFVVAQAGVLLLPLDFLLSAVATYCYFLLIIGGLLALIRKNL